MKKTVDRRWTIDDSQKNMKKVLFLIIAAVMIAMPGMAFAGNYTFDVSLVSITMDAARSAANPLGFDDWYVWKYQVTVVPDTKKGYGLSNWMLELPNCYITSPDLFKEIEASAGSASGNPCRVSIYDVEGKIKDDRNLGFKGIKWDFDSGNRLNSRGEFDYFWFSAPTSLSIEEDWGIKAGKKKIFGKIEVPDCPECGNPGVPEPTSMLLLGTGLLLGGRRFRK